MMALLVCNAIGEREIGKNRFWPGRNIMLTFSVGTEANHETFLSEYPMSWPKFKPSTSQIQVQSVTATPASSVCY